MNRYKVFVAIIIFILIGFWLYYAVSVPDTENPHEEERQSIRMHGMAYECSEVWSLKKGVIEKLNCDE